MNKWTDPLTASVSTANEGTSFTISFSTNQAGSFGYNITGGVSPADINGASLTGTVSNGSVITYTVTADATTEGTEYFTFRLDNGQAIAYVNFNDTSTTVYNETVSVTPLSVVSPNGVTFSITGGTPNGSYRFSVNNTSYDSPVYYLDASGNATSPPGNAGSGFSPGNYTIYVYFIDTGHTRQTPTWTVTSPAPTYSFYRDQSLRDEGQVITYTVTTTNVADGTRIYWINYGTTDANDFTAFTNQGFVTINNNTGSFNRQLRNDATTEGEETVWIFFYDNSGYNGDFIGYVGQTTVSDTSQTSYPAAGTFLNEYCAAYGTEPYTLNKVYANGSGGTYTESTHNSPTCGYTTPTYTLTASVGHFGEVNEGSSFTISFSTNRPGNFGYQLANVTSADLNGAPLSGTVSNGSVITYTVTADTTTEGREYFTFTLDNGQASVYVQIIDTSISYPAAGTLLSQACDGNYTRTGTYANGSGGSYNQVIEYNSAYCGYTPPAASAPLITSVTILQARFYAGETVDAQINFSGPITSDTYINIRIDAGIFGSLYYPSNGGAAQSYTTGQYGDYVVISLGTYSGYYAGPQVPGGYPEQYGCRLYAKTVNSSGTQQQAYVSSLAFVLDGGMAP